MVSLIIPIFNVEKYLNKCLESIINQKYSDFEAIMIDDGSTDNSSVICQRFCKEDLRFKYFFQKNSGVSAARNRGLQESSGEYIMFVDADDYLDSNCLKKLIDNIGGFDILLFGYNYVNERGKIIEKRNYQQYECCCFQNEFDVYKELKSNWLINAPFNKLYKKELIKNDFDTSLKMGEDLAFNLNYFSNIKTLKIIDNSLYNYVARIGSATKSFHLDALNNNLVLFSIEYSFINKFFNKPNCKETIFFYENAVWETYLGLHSSVVPKKRCLTIISNWQKSFLLSDFCSIYNSIGLDKLDFIKKDAAYQYSYTLRQYGRIRKLLKRFFR